MKSSSMQVCQEMLLLLSKFKACVGDIAEEYGLTPVQVHALYVLNENGSLPMGQVATALHCDASNVTGIIDRLMVHQLVVRNEDVNDRRTKRLELTHKGRQIIDTLFRRLPEELGFNILTRQEQVVLHSALAKLLG